MVKHPFALIEAEVEACMENPFPDRKDKCINMVVFSNICMQPSDRLGLKITCEGCGNTELCPCCPILTIVSKRSPGQILSCLFFPLFEIPFALHGLVLFSAICFSGWSLYICTCFLGFFRYVHYFT